MTEETLTYLRKAKVSEKEIARLQFEELYDHSMQILRDVLQCLGNKKYNDIKKMTFFSPAGDGYGLDNSCLNFGTIEEPIDIFEMVETLQNFEKIMKQK